MSQPLKTILDPSVLARTLERCEKAGSQGVVVFDLDSTLLNNRPRQARILREFGKARGLAALEKAQAHHWQGWDMRRAMANVGLESSEIEQFADEAKAFWRERFFTSEYCVEDEAILGAVDFVGAVAERGAQIAYVTGRHEAMRSGTLANFSRHRFVLPGERTHLLMKPTFEISDDTWKEMAYEQLRALGRVLAAFDNEPTHINGYGQAFPDALAVHLDTDHSGRDVALLPGVVSVKNFSG